jgi:hypothetical protein
LILLAPRDGFEPPTNGLTGADFARSTCRCARKYKIVQQIRIVDFAAFLGIKKQVATRLQLVEMAQMSSAAESFDARLRLSGVQSPLPQSRQQASADRIHKPAFASRTALFQAPDRR